MSTVADSLPIPQPGIQELTAEEPSLQVEPRPGQISWNPELFAAEQIGRLIRHVFLPGWPKPSRQVVFSPIDGETNISRLCLRVGEALASQAAGSVCLVEADLTEIEIARTPPANVILREGNGTSLRQLSQRISPRLWLLTQDAFMGEDGGLVGGVAPWKARGTEVGI